MYVSVIMPVYNSAKYVEAAIESVLSQTYTKWELIIIDDGSNDNTPSILDRYAQNEKRIKSIAQVNKGVSNARNVGLNQSMGELVVFLDSDDRLTPTTLKYYVDSMIDRDDVSIANGATDIFDQDLRRSLGNHSPNYHGPALPPLVELNDQVFFGINVCIRRTSIGEIRFREILTHSEDLTFLIEVATKGGLWMCLDKTTYIYRRHPDSAMQNLQGLENGYIGMLTHLSRCGRLDHHDWTTLREKVRQVMTRSWLGKGKIGRAFASWIKFTKISYEHECGVRRII